MSFKPPGFQDTCDYLREAIDRLKKQCPNVSYDDETLLFKNEVGDVIYSKRVVELVFEFHHRPDEELRNFLGAAYSRLFELTLPNLGLPVSNFRQVGYREFSWESNSRNYKAVIWYDEAPSYPLYVSVSEPGCHITWTFEFSSPPTSNQLRVAMEGAEEDVAFHLKFSAHLVDNKRKIEQINDLGAVSHFVIGPVIVFPDRGQLPVIVRERTTDYGAIRSALQLIEEFDNKPDPKLILESEPQTITTDLDLQ